MADANPLANQDDDIVLQGYQDDLDTAGKPDDVTPEMSGDASEELGVPASELRDELNNRVLDEDNAGSANNESRFDEDYAREDIESRDADMGDEQDPDRN